MDLKDIIKLLESKDHIMHSLYIVHFLPIINVVIDNIWSETPYTQAQHNKILNLHKAYNAEITKLMRDIDVQDKFYFKTCLRFLLKICDVYSKPDGTYCPLNKKKVGG